MEYFFNIRLVVDILVIVLACFVVAKISQRTLLHVRNHTSDHLRCVFHRDYIILAIALLTFAAVYAFAAFVGVSAVSYVYLFVLAVPYLSLFWLLARVHGELRTVRALSVLSVEVWLGYTYAVTFEYIHAVPAVLEILLGGLCATLLLVFTLLYVRSAETPAYHASADAMRPWRKRVMMYLVLGVIVWGGLVFVFHRFGAFQTEAERADAVLMRVGRVIDESSGRRIALINDIITTYHNEHVDDPQAMLGRLKVLAQASLKNGNEQPQIIALLTPHTLTYLDRSGGAYVGQSVSYPSKTDSNWIAASLLQAGEIGVASAGTSIFCKVRNVTAISETATDCNDQGYFSVYTPLQHEGNEKGQQDEVLVIMYPKPEYMAYLQEVQASYPGLFLADTLGDYVFGGADFISDYPEASADMLAQAGTSHAVDQGRDVYYRIVRPAFEGRYNGSIIDLNVATVPVRNEFVILGLTFDNKVAAPFIQAAATTKDLTILAPFPVGNPGSKTGYQGAQLALNEAGERAGQYHVQMKLIDATAKDFRNVDDDESNIQKIVPSLDDPSVVGEIGTMSSGAMVRMIPYYNKAGLATIGYRTTYAGLTVPDFGGEGEYERLYPSRVHTFFSLTANGEQTARETIWRVLSEEHGRILVVGDGTVFGNGIVRSFERWLARFKYDDYATTTVSLTMTTKERRQALDAVHAASTTQVLYMGFANTHTDDMFAYLADHNYTGKVYAQGFTGLQTDPSKLPATYPIYAVEYAPRPSSFSNKRAQEFVQSYRMTYGAEPTPHAVAAYEGMRLLLGAVAKSNGTREDVLRIIATTRAWPSIFGLVRFDVYGNSPHQTIEILRLQAGKWVHDEFLKHD